MIIMINGAFGSGKTTVAELLNNRIPNSMIYDPEEIGFMLRNIFSDDIKSESEKTDNFQDIVLWKELVVDVGNGLRKAYGRSLIVPMTICDRDRFLSIKDGLLKADNVITFWLNAKRKTLENRLSKRGDGVGSWPYIQIDLCEKFIETNSDLFDYIIATDDLSASCVAESIVKCVIKRKHNNGTK